MRRRDVAIDYDALVAPRRSLLYGEIAESLLETLPDRWSKAYRKMAQSPTSIHHFTHCGFEFLFDRSSELRVRGVLSGDRVVEDRVIAVFGCPNASSGNPACAKRNLLGDAAPQFGEGKGRNYLRGSVLGARLEISLFPQVRDLERERSAEGRLYRQMSRYCDEHPHTFRFTRLIYQDRSWQPAGIEHGLLKQDGSMWVHIFRNGPSESRLPAFVRNAGRRVAEIASAD